jgi:hypothetical protein
MFPGMGFLDRLFGTQEQDEAPATPRRRPPNEDERAVERYRYLLRTAPPETIEQVHAEAFTRLTEQQRALVYEELSKGSGTGERPLSSEPATLARAATRKEMRDPGSLERTLAGSGAAQNGGPSFGSMVGSAILGTVAGYVIGSALVSAFLPWDGGTDANADSGSDAGDSGDASADAGSDFGGGDFGGDFGGGDFGGDFGF